MEKTAQNQEARVNGSRIPMSQKKNIRHKPTNEEAQGGLGSKMLHI